jgi:hypothetical protein
MSNTVNHAFVSFYFTNIPHDISYLSLRKGFEVCGIMEDVYLARKRNVNGGAFGFVRYGKVKDVNKLLKALNNVWFGDWRVVAKVASFDRFGNSRGQHRVSGVGKNSDEGVKHLEEEKNETVGGVKSKEEGGSALEGEKSKIVGLVKGGDGGDVGGVKRVHKAGGGIVNVEAEAANNVYVPKYFAKESDLSWASKGVIVSVLNGEVILVVQRRISDAGFDMLNITPMGADKVFLTTDNGEDVKAIISQDAEFFEHFFTPPLSWKKDRVVRERGAWVRIYGCRFMHGTWIFSNCVFMIVVVY